MNLRYLIGKQYNQINLQLIHLGCKFRNLCYLKILQFILKRRALNKKLKFQGKLKYVNQSLNRC